VADDAVLELVKGIYRRWERGDFTSAEWADPEISFDIPGPDRELQGVEEMSRTWLGWLQSYKEMRIEAKSFHQAGDTVVVEQVFHGEGRVSGIPLDQIAGAAALTVRDRKVIRFRGFTNLRDALADAGIEPDG
jgi:ketosteroid isomerase-like protein